MTKPARIIFAGSPEFAVPPLQALIRTPYDIVAVLTQPDRPSGRGKKVMAGPVKLAALDAGLNVMQPETLKDPEVQQQLADLEPDLMVVVAYGLLLPTEVLNLPTRGCVNLHASLLPRWRGASPMQMAILHGDEETGISLMQMDEGLDTGPVYSKRRLPIGPHETAPQLHDRLAELGAEVLNGALGALLSGDLQCGRQSEDGVTYAPRIKKQDGLIAYTSMNGETLRCWAGDIGAGADGTRQPGLVQRTDKQGIHVQTGDGVLVLTSVQLAGRKQVSGADFANAHELGGLTFGT
jgi:methionyl-tRNA formyltransferase